MSLELTVRLAQHAGRIVTMLPSTPQVEAVYLNEETGILAGLIGLPDDTPALEPVSAAEVDGLVSKPPQTSSTDSTPLPKDPHTILIDQTTLDPTAAVSVAARIRDETGGRALMLDAPVSGGMPAPARGRSSKLIRQVL
jgi:3-hydroxyisobutyrate dehydrogenase